MGEYSVRESEKIWHVKAVFDYVFISQNFCTRKPELKYYKLVLKKLKIKGTDCIFIDDKERNFLPAEKLGIKCVKFDGNLNKLKNNLKSFGIIC